MKIVEYGHKHLTRVGSALLKEYITEDVSASPALGLIVNGILLLSPEEMFQSESPNYSGQVGKIMRKQLTTRSK